MRQILFPLRLRPRPRRGDYSARPEPQAGRGPTSKGYGWEWKGKGGERIEEGKGRKGRGRNAAFHHLLWSNLTTGLQSGVMSIQPPPLPCQRWTSLISCESSLAFSFHSLFHISFKQVLLNYSTATIV